MLTVEFSHSHMLELVAEAGPEAIIPLRNKSRGLAMLELASSKLGVTSQTMTSNNSRGLAMLELASSDFQGNKTFSQASQSLSEGILNNERRNFMLPNNANNSEYRFNDNAMVSRPTLTFNISVSGENEGLAERIAQAVRNVINNLSEYEERVAYA